MYELPLLVLVYQTCF